MGAMGMGIGVTGGNSGVVKRVVVIAAIDGHLSDNPARDGHFAMKCRISTTLWAAPARIAGFHSGDAENIGLSMKNTIARPA